MLLIAQIMEEKYLTGLSDRSARGQRSSTSLYILGLIDSIKFGIKGGIPHRQFFKFLEEVLLFISNQINKN